MGNEHSAVRSDGHMGYILHTRPYRETSALLEVFTKDGGRLAAVARGLRRPRSRWRGILQPFIPLWLRFSGRGELVTLTQAEVQTYASPLSGQVLWSGLYLNELLMHLLSRFVPVPTLFAQYKAVLEQLRELTSVQTGLEAVLRIFEKRLLAALGYGLSLATDAETGAAIQPDVYYCFEHGYGLLRVSQPMPDALVVSGESALALHNEDLTTPQAQRDAKRLLRAALAQQLGDKQLQSRLFYRKAEEY